MFKELILLLEGREIFSFSPLGLHTGDGGVRDPTGASPRPIHFPRICSDKPSLPALSVASAFSEFYPAP